MVKLKNIITACMAVTMLSGVTSVQAALVNFELTGTVDWAAPDNSFGVDTGAYSTITASGVFDDVALIGGSGVIDFTVSGNDMTIDVNGTIFDDSMEAYGGALMELDNGALYDLAYSATAGDFDSYFTNIISNAEFTGVWDTTVTISSVPVPAAVWLFGSGLLGLIGFARRKS